MPEPSHKWEIAREELAYIPDGRARLHPAKKDECGLK
jgi:hypothetical protein